MYSHYTGQNFEEGNVLEWQTILYPDGSGGYTNLHVKIFRTTYTPKKEILNVIT